MEWINVKDEMPKDNYGMLLVVREGKVMVADRVSVWTKTAVAWRFEHCELIFDRDNILSEEITHWMPFPELPKEKKNEV